VQATGEQFGASQIIDVLRGSRSQKVMRWRHDRLPEYGAGHERSAREWRDLAEQFICLELLQHDMEFGRLRLTAKGRQALQGGQVLVSLPLARPAAPAPTPPYEVALFERMRTLRRDLADAADLPPYVIFADSSLVEMAAYLPHSDQSFLAIRGVGERKLAQYGEPFLAAIRAYCAERGLTERPRLPNASAGSATASGGGRSLSVGAAFAAGMAPTELQARYGVLQSTIVNHLYRYLQAGYAVDPERVLALSGLTAETRSRALEALAEHGPERLRPIFDALEGAVSWEELHILRVYVLCRDASLGEGQ
jgi:ATP-dependent DNA helicase RecQ